MSGLRYNNIENLTNFYLPTKSFAVLGVFSNLPQNSNFISLLNKIMITDF